MIVDHICASPGGGAGAAAIRLHRGLSRVGLTSRFWHAPKLAAGDDASVRPLVWPRASGAGRRLADLTGCLGRTWRYQRDKRRHLAQRPSGFEIFSPAERRNATPFPSQLLTGEVLVLHWLGKMVDYSSFFASLPAGRPVVWTLHDMNPFTGGCHFASGCERFTSDCGLCPQLARAGVDDLSQRTAALKARLYSDLALHVVAPSRWLTIEARRSAAFSTARSFHTIPYGLDLDEWTCFDKRAARQELGLAPDRQVVAFGADGSGNPRKGFGCLQAAWKRLPLPRPVGLVFGNAEADAAANRGPRETDWLSLGYVSDRRRQSLIYSAADVFVLPSLEDNLPQTGLEAMACGTPVVAFEAGGIPDYVRPGVTGMLAPVGDTSALAERLTWLLAQPAEARRMGLEARWLVEREYTQEGEAASYAALFGQLVNESHAAEGDSMGSRAA